MTSVTATSDLPHIVLLDTGVSWNGIKSDRLIKVGEQSFYNESVHDAFSHGDDMLDILAENLKSKVRLSVGKVVNNAGTATPSAFAHGLTWAAGLYPDVVVIPLGLVKPHSSVKAALEILDNTKCKIFASVGNPGEGKQGSLYPAAYQECISVGSACFQRDYSSWKDKPNLVMQEVMSVTNNLRSMPMGTATATMLAVAEYINRNNHSNHNSFSENLNLPSHYC